MNYPGARGSELADKPVQVEWVQYPGAGPTIDLSIGSSDIAHFSGEFTDEDITDAIRFAGIRVHEDFRGAGVATRLVSALAHMAIRHNATTMYGFVESQHTLRIFRQLTGDAAISYVSPDPITGEQVTDTDQAITALERAEEYEPDLEHRDLGVEVHVDLTGIDVSILEQPVEVNEPLL